MPNQLTNENSPYLLQHAHNPVDWYPWGEKALRKARDEDKLIFLSIGYAACHWCHVMERESFEDEEIAALMNEHFVNIKVDREERPDLDNIYMQAVVAMTGQGGWPMSVFLTPNGQPVYGGTYFPPEPRYQMPSFQEVLLTIIRLWQQDRARLLESGEKITRHLQKMAENRDPGKAITPDVLQNAVLGLRQSYDWHDGGWGQSPKFPQAMAIEFLLRQATRGDQAALNMSIHALESMARGGMYDVVGGGFARYSVDDYWLVPHFEKMLYDNAQLGRAYLHAYLLTGDDRFRRVCEETLLFVQRELTHPEGGFFSSLDADSEGKEGIFYTWSPSEIQSALNDQALVAFYLAAYGVTQKGNFEGKNILQRALDDEQLAKEFNIPIGEVSNRITHCHTLLLKERAKRVRPRTDDKVLVFWNALMLTTFAEAGRYLKCEAYTQMAIKNAKFLLENMYQQGRLLRSWRNGQVKYNAYLEDYASLILALLALYQSDPNPDWFNTAHKLTEEMLTHFSDPQGGFFDTRADHEELLVRPKDLQDNAAPSGNALAALALLQLSTYNANPAWRALAEKMLGGMQALMTRYPTGFAQWLSAADFAIGPVQEVAIVGDLDSPQTKELVATLWEQYRPRLVAAISTPSNVPQEPKLLANRAQLNDQATAYVCQAFVCQQPVTSEGDLRSQL